MSNSRQPKIIKVSILGNADRDVELMANRDYWSFVLAIKRICEQRNLDICNYAHFSCAVEILKHQVSWN
jgi:hypothetical protein